MLSRVLYIIIFSLIFLLAACGREATPPPNPVPQQLRLSLLPNQIAPQGGLYLEDQISAWGEENNVNITFERNAPNPTNPPDCGQIGAAALPALLVDDQLVDITDLVNSLSQESGGIIQGG